MHVVSLMHKWTTISSLSECLSSLAVFMVSILQAFYKHFTSIYKHWFINIFVKSLPSRITYSLYHKYRQVLLFHVTLIHHMYATFLYVMWTYFPCIIHVLHTVCFWSWLMYLIFSCILLLPCQSTRYHKIRCRYQMFYSSCKSSCYANKVT